MMSDPELRAMDLTVQLVNLVCGEIIGHRSSRDGDVAEFVRHIHSIQQMLMSQAAGRAHPDRFRLLGELITEGETT